MSGGSRSTQQTSTSNTDARSVTDNSGNSGVLGSGNSITNIMTDAGLVRFADDLSNVAFATNAQNTSAAISAVQETNRNSLAAVNASQVNAFGFVDSLSHLFADSAANAESGVADAYRRSGDQLAQAYTDAKGEGVTTKYLAIGALVLAGFVAYAALRRR